MFRKLLISTAAIAIMVPGLASAAWQQGSSKHFVVYSNDSPANVKAITTKLERFDKAVRSALGMREPEVGANARVTVFVLPSMSDVQKMMGTNANIAGYYKSVPPGPIAFVFKNDSSLLQHEYTHHLMYSSWGDVVFPGWFSEGFAEMFSTAKLRDDGSVVIGAPPLDRTYGIDMMNLYPIEKLIDGYPNYRDAMQAQVFYGRSWLLTHYMMFDKNRAKALAAYIGAINEGKSREDAQKILGVSARTDLALNAYGKSRTVPGATLSADQLKIGEVTTRPLTAGEAAVMPMMMRSRNGVDPKAAQEVVVALRAAAAPYPDDAGAQSALAEAEYDVANYAASEAAADRLLAVDPKSVRGLIYKGMAQTAILKKANETDPAKWTTARRWFLAANKADSLYSYPIQLFYESFADAKQAPTRGAKDGLLFAYKLSPQNSELRYEVAKVLLADNRVKAARAALEPIAYSERPGPMADVAKKAITTLDSSGAAAALASLDTAEAEAKKKAEDAAKIKKKS